MAPLFSTFKKFFEKKLLLAVILLLSIFSAGLEVGIIYGLSQFDKLIGLRDVGYVVILLMSVAAISMLARAATIWFTNNLVLEFTSSISRQVYNLGCIKAFNGRYKISELISLAEKCQIIGTSVLVPVFNAVSALVIACSLVIALVYMYGQYTLISLGLIFVFYIAMVISVKSRLWNHSQRLAKYQNDRAAIISDTLNGAHELFAYQKRDKVLDTYGTNEGIFINSASKVLFFGAVPKFIIESILVVLLLLVVYVNQKSGGVMAVADLLAFGFGGIRLVPLFQQVYNGWARLRANKKALSEIVNFLDVNEKGVKVDGVPVFSLSGEDFVFHWSELPAHVNFSSSSLQMTLSPSKITLLEGPSGSGKSTLVNSLIRCAYLQKMSIGIVAPYNSRFGISVADYFNFFGVATEKELPVLLAKFGLVTGCDSMAFLNLKLSKLSTGEFQRVQFARDILLKPDLLVIDESFSNIDHATVEIIKSELQKMRKTRFLLISHMKLNISNIQESVRLG